MGTVFGLAQEMLILLVIACVGFIMSRKRILPEATSLVLTQIVLYITLPCLIIYSMDVTFSRELVVDVTWLLAMSAFALLCATLIGYVMRKKANLTSSRKGVYEAAIIFGNQGFLGYAITFLLFGEIGVLYTAFFMIFFLFYVWTYVLYVVAKQEQKVSWKQLLLNPGVLSTLIGVFVMIMPFGFPQVISNLLSDIGTMTVPLSMVLIGSLLASISWADFKSIVKSRYVWYATGAKLLFLPLVLLPFIWLPVSTLVIGVAILVTATPTAPTVPMFAQKYGGDVAFSTVIVSTTTILCVITIPLLYGMILLLR